MTLLVQPRWQRRQMRARRDLRSPQADCSRTGPNCPSACATTEPKCHQPTTTHLGAHRATCSSCVPFISRLSVAAAAATGVPPCNRGNSLGQSRIICSSRRKVAVSCLPYLTNPRLSAVGRCASGVSMIPLPLSGAIEARDPRIQGDGAACAAGILPGNHALLPERSSTQELAAIVCPSYS